MPASVELQKDKLLKAIKKMAAGNGNGMNHKIKQFMHKLANART
jgi:hypothetical protein